MSVKTRNLFKELKQGIQEMQEHKAGKITLRTHAITKCPPLKVNASSIRQMREDLNLQSHSG
jgi:putative transcriptional regulator